MKETFLFDIMETRQINPDGGYMNIEKEKIGKLIEQIQGGNKDAFDELYRLTSPKAYFVALKIVRNEHDAEDILQETYIKVLEKIGEIDPSQSFMGWLYRVVSNKSKNLLKKKNAVLFEPCEEEEFEDIPDERVDFNPEESLDRSEICREVMAAIDELSDEKRICVIMKYFGEMTVNEIAESLEVPESTVRNRVFVARKELKNKFENKSSTVFCSAVPVAVVVWALNQTAEAVSVEFAAGAASAAVLTGIGASSASATVGTTAAATGTGIAAKAAALSVTQKVVAGVAAVSIVGGSTAGVVTVVKNNSKPDNESSTYIEEVTTAPFQTAEYVFEFITEATESTSVTESTTREKRTVPSISIPRHSTTEQISTEPVTTRAETTTQKVTTTKRETTTQTATTTQTETTTQPSTTETTVQQTATLIIDVTDMDDNVIDTLTLPVDAGTEMTWDFLITLISENGYEAMAGVYGDGVGETAQAGETYNFTAEL